MIYEQFEIQQTEKCGNKPFYSIDYSDNEIALIANLETNTEYYLRVRGKYKNRVS
jgi:hypothetical protein